MTTRELIHTVRVVQEFSDELEADLLEHYAIDLLDLWRERLSLRRVSVLIKGLMHKEGRSQLLAALDETTVWSTQDHLMARVSDALELSNFLFLKAHSESASNLTPPDPLPRPGAASAAPEEPAEEFASGDELARFFQEMSNM